MDGPRYQRLCLLFEQASNLPESEYESFVTENASDDPELATALRAALGELKSPSTFLAKGMPSLLSEVSIAPPDLLGGYRLVRLLGSGGMGRVYLAQQSEPSRLVALKVAHESELTKEGARRFAREAELLGRLDHPGISRVYQAGGEATARGRFAFIAMEYVVGTPLAALIRNPEGGKPLPIDHSTEIVENLARALHAAHEVGIVHRDVKPENVIIRPDGRATLVDFGIARDLLESASDLTRTGLLLGTPAYMAPEQIDGSSVVGGWTDVWALGLLLFECLTGRRPFEAPTREGLFDAILRGSPRKLRTLRPDLPRDLDVIVSVAIERDPSRRYASALALADDLARLRSHRPVSVREPGPLARSIRWARRSPALAASIGASVVLTLVAAASLGFLAARWGDIEEGRESTRRRRIEQELDLAWLVFSDGDRIGGLRRVEDLAKSGDGGDEVEFAGEVMRALVEGREPETARIDASMAEFFAGQKELYRGLDGERNRYESARSHFEKAIIDAPVPRALFHISRLHSMAEVEAGPVVAAAADALVRRFPDSLAVAAAAAGALTRTAPARSEDMFRKALDRWRDEPALENGLAIALLKQGKIEEAIDLLRKLTARRPELVSVRSNLANLLGLARRFDEALVLARDAAARAPGDARAQQVLGEIARARGDTDLALRQYRAAEALAPENTTILERLGDLLRDSGDFPASIQIHQRRCRLMPRVASAHSDLATVLFMAGRPEEAAVECRQAIELDSREHVARVNLASILQGRGELHSALRWAREAIDLQPEQAETWVIVGLCESELFHLPEALDAYRRADEIGRKRAAWEAPTDRFIAELESRMAIGSPQPVWLQATDAARALCDQGHFGDAIKELEKAVDELEDALDGSRISLKAIHRNLVILGDDPALKQLADSSRLANFDAQTELRVRAVLRRLQDLEKDTEN